MSEWSQDDTEGAPILLKLTEEEWAHLATILKLLKRMTGAKKGKADNPYLNRDQCSAAIEAMIRAAAILRGTDAR